MKQKLRKVDEAIKEILKIRIYIYIDTPMVAPWLWMRDGIDRTEAYHYRSINYLHKFISNRTLI